jgi:hypothetical protein
MIAPLIVVAIRLSNARAALRCLGLLLSHHFATHSHPIGLSSLGEWVCGTTALVLVFLTVMLKQHMQRTPN